MLLALGCTDTGYLDAISQSPPIGAHLERQERALWFLRWGPWILFFAASLLTILLGWQWQRWSKPRLRRSIGLLLGSAIALPLLFTLSPLYVLFFGIAEPEAKEIAAAISEAMNCLAFAVLLDVSL